MTFAIFGSIGLFISFENVEVLFDMIFVQNKTIIWCWLMVGFDTSGYTDTALNHLELILAHEIKVLWMTLFNP